MSGLTPSEMADKLTKGQAAFYSAVAAGEPTEFHRRVVEPVERLGLVRCLHQFRRVGCNSFSARDFVLTEVSA